MPLLSMLRKKKTMKMIRLENVIDTRTGKTHSVAIVPANEEKEEVSEDKE